LHDPIPTGPIYARFSRGWAEVIPDWRIVQRLASIWRTVQKKSCSCSMTFLSVPSCHLWLSFPITRDDNDSLRLAQSSPRRKHETVHRSSACGVRIRRHNRWPPYRRFLLGRRLADGHFSVSRESVHWPKRKSDFALHSADNAKATEMCFTARFPAVRQNWLQPGRAHGLGPGGRRFKILFPPINPFQQAIT